MAARTPKNQRAGSAFVAHVAGAQAAVSDAGSKAPRLALPAWVEARPKASFPKSPPNCPTSTSGLSSATTPAAAKPDRLLTVREVAALFQVSEKTIRRFIALGDLPVVRLGRSVRLHPEAIEKIVRNNE